MEPEPPSDSHDRSHCHLAGEEFVADLDAVVARARAAGVSRALVILAAEDDAEIDAGADGAARPGRRAGSRSACIRIRRSVFAADPAGGGRAVAAAGSTRCRRRARSARSASTTTTISRRATCSRRSSARRSALARRAATCRSSSTPARPRTTRCGSSREEGSGRAARRVPLLHRRPGGGRAGAGDRLLPLDSPAIVTFPEGRSNSAQAVARRCPLDRLLVETDSPVSGAGSASRQAQRAGVRGAGRRRSWPRVRGVTAAAIGEQTDRQLRPPVRP